MELGERSKMEPIAKRLRQSAQDALGNANTKPQEDLSDRIKQLEAELQAGSESSSSESGSESDESSDSDNDNDSDSDESDAGDNDDDDDDRRHSKRKHDAKERKKSDKEQLVLRLSSLKSERVESLPESCLPRASCSSKTLEKTKRKSKKTKNGEQPQEAASDPLAWAQEVLSLPKKIPFACRPCGFVGKNLEEFQAHCSTSDHEAKQATRHQILHCRICDKKFTSAAQLSEHKQGKWHQSRINKRRERHVVKICYDFLRGSCRRGDQCAFEHTETKAVVTGKALAKRKQLPCRSFSETGSCKFGDKCLYAHAK